MLRSLLKILIVCQMICHRKLCEDMKLQQIAESALVGGHYFILHIKASDQECCKRSYGQEYDKIRFF